MLVTDSALQDMEREAESLIRHLRRILGRLRRQPSVALAQSRTLSSRPAGRGELAPVSSFPCAIATPIPVGPARNLTPGVRPDQPGDLVTPAPDGSFKWRRHPQLRDRNGSPADRSPEEFHQGARAAATRGLFLARSERLGEARAAFAHAAADTSIDLTELPGFWRLSRGAMLVAAVAYEDVERYRDAAALSARIRTRYRPRALPPTASPSRRQATGGGC